LFGLSLPAEGGDQPPGVSLTMSLAKQRLYQGESTTISVTLKLRDTVIRNIGYPVLPATGMSVGGFGTPHQQETQTDGVTTTSYEFTASVTPHKSGVFRLGPASVDGEILVPASGPAGFYGESTTSKIRFSSSTSDLTVLPLPAAGRPKDFSGAIGKFTLSMSAQPTTVQVGDPVTVTTLISGVGNLSTIKCPELTGTGFKSYPSQSSIAAGGLRCEQVLIPAAITSDQLPQAQLSFFDPATGRYHTLQSASIHLSISNKLPENKAKLNSPPSQTFVSGQKSRYWLWLLPVFPALAIVLFFLYRKRTGRNLPSTQQHSNQRDLSLHLRDAEQALALHDVDIFYNAVFRVAEIMLADQETKNSQDDNSTAGKSPDSIRTKSGTYKIHEINKIITACDAVRYGCHLPESMEMQELFSRLKHLL